MLAKAKAGMMHSADVTARTAKQTKLKGDIMMLQQKVGATKKEFGPLVYEQMAAGNKAEVERLFNETKARIDALEADIAGKRAHIQDLKVPGTPRGSSGDAMAHPPPPGPPPPAAGGPPPGWRATKTAEGKEYYYNETTGETSWTLPIS